MPTPRVPAHAWSWLQRSRGVLAEIGTRLYGESPPTGLVDELRRLLPVDDFVRDVVFDVVCEQAFGGKPPDRRPAGVSWDRGLVWWAATLRGLTPAEFEAGGADPPAQPALFGPEPAPAAKPGPAPVPRPRVSERRALAAALRALLAEAEDEQVPASAVRRLLRELEP
jgi:hypothetical protein